MVAVIGVDVGGTFTDVVAAVDGELITFKTPSTSSDPSQAVIAALDRLGIPSYRLLHGTTVATNAVLERNGAPTAFIGTAGYRDLLHIGRQTRQYIYDLRPQPTPSVIPRDLCFEIPERITHEGEVLAAPTSAAVRKLVRALEGIESVAVCFLFSFVRPEHELFVGERLGSRYVSLSHEIAPEFREYERASTTAINAYVGPRMAGYLGRLASGAEARGATKLRIMHSNGGALSVAEAARHPVTTLLSGPAAGVVAAWEVARSAGVRRAVSFDMGGTSTDVSLIDGRPVSRAGGEIDGMPVRVPMMDIHTVGAGGGSIAWIDDAGALRVGPQSAGADPGPAAYGRGNYFTVTDANLLLGRLIPETFAGGNLELDVDRTRRTGKDLAKKLHITSPELCSGVIGTANANMARAVRKVSLERGYDPAGLALIPFGGSGPLHACALAEEIGIQRIVVPPAPGLLSALGLLLAPVQREAVRSVMLRGEVTSRRLARVVQELTRLAERPLLDDGIKNVRLSYFADLRYDGQAWELSVPLDPANPVASVAAFYRLHKKRYGYAVDGTVEWVTLRARATGPAERPRLPSGGTRLQNLPRNVVDRWSIRRAIVGPRVIVQSDTTTYLAKGWRAAPDASGNLILTQT